MGFARLGLRGSFLLLGFAALSAPCLAASTDSAMSGTYSARDIRTQTRTHWDYQPGQGPHVPLRDRRCANCLSSKVTEPLTPPPPVETGDWKDPPTAEALVPPETPSILPQTETSVELGLQVSNYHYHEKDLGMKIQGPSYGFTAAYTGAIGSGLFVRTEGRFSGSEPEYKGTGLEKDVPNYIAEARAVIGGDLMFGRFGVSPYVGIGYRFLRSDLQSLTNDRVGGYSRDSHYLFAPIGLQPKLRFPNGDRLVLTAEYDPLIRGWQKSYFSDISALWPDIQNRQKSGYGLRGELSYETTRWSFGPFVNYWNINQSTTDCGWGEVVDGWIGYACGYEPHNHTVEYGMNLRYRFH